jgi:hypothetical protein
MFVEALAFQGVLAVAHDLAGGRRRPIIQQEFREAAMAGELRDQRRVQRSRFLDRIGVVASFESGLLPIPDRDAVVLKPMLMVVTEPDLVLVASEIGEDVETEYARLPRDGITTVRVLDVEGNPAPDSLVHPRDELDPIVSGTFVLGVDLVDRDRIGLVFRSANGAGEAADRLERFLVPAS